MSIVDAYELDDLRVAAKRAAYLQQENDVLHERVRKLEIALAQEREACAKVAEKYGLQVDTTSTTEIDDALRLGKIAAAYDIATLIRGRGEK